jgi:lactose/L-arabinose transport system permease protein
LAREPKKGPRFGLSSAVPYLFVAPFFLLFAGFILYPILYSAALSFGQFSGGSISFVGLENYRRLLSDGLFLKSLLNTGLILVIQVPLMIGLATVIASVIDSDLLGKRRKAAFRLAFFLPVAIDLVTYSVVFSLIFSERYGIVNQALGFVGIDGHRLAVGPFLGAGAHNPRGDVAVDGVQRRDPALRPPEHPEGPLRRRRAWTARGA